MELLDFEQIEQRIAEIRSMNLDELDINAINEINTELDQLQERKATLKQEVESKKELRAKILNDEVETTIIEKPMEERKMTNLTVENYLESKEYRSAFLKKLQGKELNTEERAAIALAGADAVVPHDLQNDILTKAKEYAPVLNHITLLNVNGAVRFAVEGVTGAAEDHTENASITPASDTMVEVELSTHEITKMIQISTSVKQMAMSSFEAWLINQLAEAIAMKVESKVFETMMAAASPVGAGVTTDNVFKLFGALKAGYARGAKVYMSRNTLYTKVLGLQDKAKNDLVVFENGVYKLLGVAIETTESVAGILLCDPRKFVGNLAEQINVKDAYDINTNSYKYLGVALYDGKVAIEEAFQKLTAE